MAKTKATYPTLEQERHWRSKGFEIIYGVDEAGKGALAASVYVGACSLPLDNPELETILKDVRDSKTLSEKKRNELYDVITSIAFTWGVGSATAEEIDAIGITHAISRAARKAILEAATRPDRNMDTHPNYCLFDKGIEAAWRGRQIEKADRDILSVACASILAKVSRDRTMLEYHQQYPLYGFDRHKGYGTKDHIAAIKEHGYLPIHRQSFKLKQFAEDNQGV